MLFRSSLAKAFSAGGAVMVFPDAETARLVRTCGSTMIFSGPLQPPLLGAAIASARVHLSPEIHERQKKLMERICLFNSLADQRGLPLGSAAATPIRFVRTGDNDTTYQIVGVYEADIKGGRLSVSSPLAKALIGKTVGDTISVPAPGGDRSYEILGVKFV